MRPNRSRLLRSGTLLAVTMALSCESVTVTPLDVSTVEVSPSTASLAIGDTLLLQATVLHDTTVLTGRDISWISSQPAVVSVDATGTITGLAVGSATVTATSAGMSGSATIVVTGGQGFVLDRSSLSFTAQAGGTTSGPEAVLVTGTGGATVSGLEAETGYDPDGPTGWLAATLSSTTTPAALSIVADGGSLPIGSYGGTITVRAPQLATQTIRVTLNVSGSAPVIQLSRNVVAFSAFEAGASPPPELVTISNAGGGTLGSLSASVSYAQGEPGGWLAASVLGLQAPTSLRLEATQDGLDPGTYSAVVQVLSPVAANSPTSLQVTMTVSQGAGVPRIGVSSDSIHFIGSLGAANPTPKTVRITNQGLGVLDGIGTSVGYAPGQPTAWLVTSLSSTSAPADLTLSPELGSLSAGTYTASVEIASAAASNSPRIVTVIFEVRSGPSITLSQGSVTFAATEGGADPGGQTVSVTNGSTGSLTGLAAAVSYGTGPTGWLSASLNRSTAPATLSLNASTGSLPSGSYTATVEISSPVASNSPSFVDVRFTITPQSSTPPTISLDQTSVGFQASEGGSNPGAESVSVSNSGGGTLDGLSTQISYGSGSNWLTATLSSTTAPATITLRATTGSRSAGTYTATVSVGSSASGVTNSPQTISVTFTVLPSPPQIALNPTSLSFSRAQGTGNPAAKTVSVANSGGQSLTGLNTTIQYRGGASGWLNVTLSSTTAPATITVRPTTGSLSQGTYRADVEVRSPVASNSPQEFQVTFQVTAPPTIALSPSSLSFTTNQGGLDPATKTVSVTNSGTGNLNQLSIAGVSYGGGGSGWLTAQLTSAAAPSTLRLTPRVGSLGQGTYTARVEIESGAAGVSNSPQFVDVTFDVTPPPTIVIDKGSVLIRIQQGSSGSDVVQITEQNGNPMTGLSTTVNYTGGGSAGWLNPSLSSTSAPATLTLSANAGNRAVGIYTADVNILAPGGTNSPRDVQVTLDITPGPTIGLSDLSTTFSAPLGGAAPSEQTISILNTGGGSLTNLSRSISYTGGPNATTGWLTATLDGSSAPTTLRLNVDPSRTGLTQGTYTATVTITSPVATNSPQQITVRFIVN